MSLPNYSYILDLALRISPTKNPSILDYGCGMGQVVAIGLSKGLNIFGVDKYGYGYEDWMDRLEPSVQPYISKLLEDRIPTQDNMYDVVISNQVFEHIPDHYQPLREIHRILKPGGVFIAIFPVKETWFEGHVKLYFPHLLDRWPSLQYAYMYCCRALGFGEPKPGLTTSGWAADRQKVLRTVCFYCSRMDFENKLRVIWSAEPKFYMTDYMKWRISNSSRFALLKYMLNHIQLDYLLNFFCLRRGSLIVAIKK